jgi:hypothetical protein
MPKKDPCYDTRRERESWITSRLALEGLGMLLFCFFKLLNGVETYFDIGMSGTFSEWM